MDAFLLTERPLDAQAVSDGLVTPADGALVVFSGVVRERNRGRNVLFLEYEAFPEMAVPVLEQVAREIAERFEVTRLRVHHRIGRVEIRETSVVVAAASRHRGHAFRAAQHMMNELKRVVPIWKREHFEGGDVWVEGPKAPITE